MIKIQDLKSEQVSGADLLVETLKKLDVEVIFCITGAGNLAIVDALVRDASIKVIYSHHEQAAVMEAQGYSRISGRLGVALVTTGGGTSNVVTGILSAHLDSIPILLISGNESSFHCENPHGLRAYGVQGFDSVAVLKPITKNSIRIATVEEVITKTNNCASEAIMDRKGPTHLDFPMDLQRKIINRNNVEIEEEKILPKRDFNDQESLFLDDLSSALVKSKKPVIYIGNGCRDDKTKVKLRRFLDKYQIPYFLSWSAIDFFPENDKLNMGRVGIYGDRASNIAIQKADLVLTLGTRLAIPQIGYDRKDFARNATKWIVEIDTSECSKFEGLGWNVINSDVEKVIDALDSRLGGLEEPRFDLSSWIDEMCKIWHHLPRIQQVGQREFNENYLHSADAIFEINQYLDDDAVVVTDVGAALLNGHYIFEKQGEQRLFTSQGLGEMGFGLPGAIGAFFAAPENQIVCLNTDGAMMFNLQELQLVNEHQIPLKLFVFNNSGYSMIKISQENLFSSRIAGSSTDSGISFPSFKDVATTFNFEYVRIKNKKEIQSALDKHLRTKVAVLFEIIMHPDQKYMPRLATTKLADGTLVSPPLEDMDPQLEISLLEKLLDGKLHENSKVSRAKK